MRFPAFDLYKELGVTPTATLEEIDAAYKKLARQFHPDLNPAPEAAERMQRINEAKRILSDASERVLYDSQRRAAGNPTPNMGNTTQGGQAGPADATIRIRVGNNVYVFRQGYDPANLFNLMMTDPAAAGFDPAVIDMINQLLGDIGTTTQSQSDLLRLKREQEARHQRLRREQAARQQRLQREQAQRQQRLQREQAARQQRLQRQRTHSNPRATPAPRHVSPHSLGMIPVVVSVAFLILIATLLVLSAFNISVGW